jgi:hypothetical protein
VTTEFGSGKVFGKCVGYMLKYIVYCKYVTSLEVTMYFLNKEGNKMKKVTCLASYNIHSYITKQYMITEPVSSDFTSV